MKVEYIPHRLGKQSAAIQMGGLINPAELRTSKHKPFVNSNKPNCVVYQLWAGNFPLMGESYLTYLQYSIMSQMAHTDIREYSDMYIFVSESLYGQVVYHLSTLVDESCIISVRNNFAYKYVISTHPILENYNSISIIDADMFLYSKEQSTFYKDIVEYFKTDNTTTFLLPQYEENTKYALNSRLIEYDINMTQSEFEIFLIKNSGISSEKLNSFLTDTHWWLSCVTIFNPRKFTRSDKSNYYKLMNANSLIGLWDDELVWLLWLYINDKKIKDVTTQFNAKFKLDIDTHKYKFERGLQLIHPIVARNFFNYQPIVVMENIKNAYLK